MICEWSYVKIETSWLADPERETIKYAARRRVGHRNASRKRLIRFSFTSQTGHSMVRAW